MQMRDSEGNGNDHFACLHIYQSRTLAASPASRSLRKPRETIKKRLAADTEEDRTVEFYVCVCVCADTLPRRRWHHTINPPPLPTHTHTKLHIILSGKLYIWTEKETGREGREGKGN